MAFWNLNNHNSNRIRDIPDLNGKTILVTGAEPAVYICSRHLETNLELKPHAGKADLGDFFHGYSFRPATRRIGF